MVPRTFLFVYVYTQRLMVLRRKKVWPPRSIWQFSDTLIVATAGGGGATADIEGVQSPWVLLNILQCKGEPPPPNKESSGPKHQYC